MKIAVLSSASAGGAGIAAHRIYEALKQRKDISVDFLDMSILGHAPVEVSPHESATNREITNTHFTTDFATESRDWLIELLADYDYLNIQWSSYLLSIAEILELARSGKKILFTLHDFYYITGGCHYPAGCTGYQQDCIGCPQVNESIYRQQDVMHALQLKREIFSYPNVHLSAPSHYIVNKAIQSGIIPAQRGHVLRNAYQPIDSQNEPGIQDVFSLLLIADSFLEERKGIELAVESIKLLCESQQTNNESFILHIVGNCEQDIASLLPASGLTLISHGHINKHKELVGIFKQCQYMLTCSYEDNWPNILVEAGAYGCIPITGKGHGCEEFCVKFDCGFVANEQTPEAYAQVLSLAMTAFRNGTKDQLIEKIRDTHSYIKVADQYTAEFRQISPSNDTEKIGLKETALDAEQSEKFTCSGNFLARYSRKLLLSLRENNSLFDCLEVSLKASPFTNSEAEKKLYLVALLEDRKSHIFPVTFNESALIPAVINGSWINCVFLTGQHSFGISHLTINSLHDYSLQKIEQHLQENNFVPFRGINGSGPLIINIKESSRYIRFSLQVCEPFHLDKIEVYDSLGQNIATEKSVTTSSIFKDEEKFSGQGAVNGRKTAGHGFHTEEETSPWLILDLEETYNIRKICVFNSDDHFVRAMSLKIESSLDGKTWSSIHDNYRAIKSLDESQFSSWDRALIHASVLEREITSRFLDDLLQRKQNSKAQLFLQQSNHLLRHTGVAFGPHGYSETFGVCSEQQKQLILSEVHKFLEILSIEFGVTSFVSSGTLLGLVRENGFNDHDDDIDLCYLSNHSVESDILCEREELIAFLKNKGYQVTQSPLAHLFCKSSLGIGMDLFTGFIEGLNCSMNPLTRKGISVTEILPLKENTISGFTWKLPRNPDALLVLNFGADWRTPDPFWTFDWSNSRSQYEFLYFDQTQ